MLDDFFNQSECTISALLCYPALKFVYGMDSRGPPFKNAASAVHQTRVKLLIKGLTGLQPFLPKCGPPFHDCNHVKPFRVKMKPFGWNLKQKVNLNKWFVGPWWPSVLVIYSSDPSFSEKCCYFRNKQIFINSDLVIFQSVYFNAFFRLQT